MADFDIDVDDEVDEREVIKTPRILSNLLGGAGQLPIIQILDWTNAPNKNIRFNASDGKNNTWFIEADETLRTDLKHLSNIKGIIEVTKHKVYKGMTMHITEFNIIINSQTNTSIPNLDTLGRPFYENIIKANCLF